MSVPEQPKVYHIVHHDRLRSIISTGGLLCDAESMRIKTAGTTIGISNIKQRRLHRLSLTSHPGLKIGKCVPFYFCPRSVMLYVIYMANNSELTYREGQIPIVHLEADLHRSVKWAERTGRRWAFTLSNAGSNYFEDRCDLSQLDEIDWDAVQADRWAGRNIPSFVKEGKQAEFLVEQRFPWKLVERIGLYSQEIARQVGKSLALARHKPLVEIKREWYY